MPYRPIYTEQPCDDAGPIERAGITVIAIVGVLYLAFGVLFCGAV